MRVVIPVYYRLEVKDEAQADEYAAVLLEECRKGAAAGRADWGVTEDTISVVGSYVVVVD